MQREERKEADTGPEEVPAGERAGTGELADREGYAVELVVVSRAALLKRTGKTRTFRKERL